MADNQQKLGEEGQESKLPPRNNLGWLASSASVPQRKKEIEGVGAGSLVSLKTQLYRSQEHVRLRKEGVIDVSERHVRRKLGVDVAAMSRSNTGVDDRAAKDRLHIKTPADKASESYAALERKALLYDRLARGDVEVGDEDYEVDFQRKGTYQQEEDEESQRAGSSSRGRSATAEGQNYDNADDWAGGVTGGMVSNDMLRERERQQWEKQERQDMASGQASEEADDARRKHQSDIRDINAETNAQRERAAHQKDKLGEQEAARRQKLIRQKLQQMKAKTSSTAK